MIYATNITWFGDQIWLNMYSIIYAIDIWFCVWYKKCPNVLWGESNTFKPIKIKREIQFQIAFFWCLSKKQIFDFQTLCQWHDDLVNDMMSTRYTWTIVQRRDQAANSNWYKKLCYLTSKTVTHHTHILFVNLSGLN